MKKYKALLLDFYGTLVEEDDKIIEAITQTIISRSPVNLDQRSIGNAWYSYFQKLCSEAHGDKFALQRKLEMESITQVLATYHIELEAELLAEQMFTYWQSPLLYDDTLSFLANNKLPFCIVSNIDRGDLLAAVQHNKIKCKLTVTSEDCRSYKPRPEMFCRALELLQCDKSEVLHLGDSWSSDVVGASQLGIDVAWVNRKGRAIPEGKIEPSYCVRNLHELYSITNS